MNWDKYRRPDRTISLIHFFYDELESEFGCESGMELFAEDKAEWVENRQLIRSRQAAVVLGLLVVQEYRRRRREEDD